MSWCAPKKRVALNIRDNCQCCYCGKQLILRTHDCTLDHVHPRHAGGSNDASNLVTACLSCNSSKQDCTLSSWLDSREDLDADAIKRRVRNWTRRSTARHLAWAAGYLAEYEASKQVAKAA